MKRTSLLAGAMQVLCLWVALQTSGSCSQAGQDVTGAIDRSVAGLFSAEDAAPGMMVAVVRNDRVIYEKGFGYADRESGRRVTADTAFYVASTTKAFTALAAIMLDYRGLMRLDGAFSTYVPGAQFRPPLSADAITVRDLLGMTHGIDQSTDPIVVRTAYTGDFTTDQLVGFLDFYKPAKAGRAFAYGNLGYNLASLAMEFSQRQGWREIVQEQVFSPLKMRSTTAYVSKVPKSRMALPYQYDVAGGMRRTPIAKADATMHAAGGHFSTGKDLARFLIAQLNEGRISGKQALPAEVIARSHVQHVAQDAQFGPFHRHGWSLGFDLGTYSGELLLHRFGSYRGYMSHVSFMPERGLGVAVLVNEATTGGLLSSAVATAIYDVLLDKAGNEADRLASIDRYRSLLKQGKEAMQRDLARRQSRSQKLAFDTDAYTGTFRNELFGTMVWTRIADALRAKFGLMESEVEVYDAARNQLRVELLGGGNVATFQVENGKATSIDMLGYKFERVE